MYIKKFYKYNYDLILELDHEHCKHFICEDDFKLLFRVFNIINEYDLLFDIFLYEIIGLLSIISYFNSEQKIIIIDMIDLLKNNIDEYKKNWYKAHKIKELIYLYSDKIKMDREIRKYLENNIEKNTYTKEYTNIKNNYSLSKKLDKE